MSVDFLSALNKNGSGMNLTEIASSLVEAETTPRRNIAENRITEAEVAVSAFAELANQMNYLDQTLNIAREQAALTASSSNSAVSIEIDNANASNAMQSTIEVQQLARPQVLEFSGFTDPNELMDGGELQIQFGSWSDDVPPQFTDNGRAMGGTWTFDDDTTLQDFASQIDKTFGMTAELIRVGDGTYSLAITTETGTDNAVNFTATSTSTAGNALTLDQFDTNADVSTVQVQTAQNAELSYNGINVSRTTNEIDDLIDGANVTLNDVTTSPANLSISTNAQSAFEVMDAMLLQLNIVNQFMLEITKKGMTPEDSGSLAGNSGADTIKRNFQSVLNGGFEGFGDRSLFLSDFGVQTQRDGTLTLDRDTFMSTFNNDPAAFDALFQDGLSADTEGFTFFGSPELSKSQKFVFDRDTTTGEATLDGVPLVEIDSFDGETIYQVNSGALLGTRFSVDSGTNSATIQYGRSFASNMQSETREMLSSTGILTRQEDAMQTVISDQNIRLSEIDEQATTLENRYRAQFTAMELVVSNLNSTGEYLTNLVAQWNNQD